MPDSILVLVAFAVAWFVGRRLWPYGPCRLCRGTGRSPGSNGRRWGFCPRCGGTRTRTRFGARRD